MDYQPEQADPYNNGITHNGGYVQQRVIEVPLKASDGEETQTLEIECETLDEDPTELSDILAQEEVDYTYWIKFAFEYNRKGMVDNAISMLRRYLDSISTSTSERVPLCSFLASLYLRKARFAPKGQGDENGIIFKEQFHQQALQYINEANRIDPQHTLSTINTAIYRLCTGMDRAAVDNALKGFEESLRQHPSNTIALIGKARIFLGRNQSAVALKLYQRCLQTNPEMRPDPRIGIGQCFWQLKMKEDARYAWQRALELDPDGPSANILLGMWYLDAAVHLPIADPKFVENYGKAMQYAQKAYKKSPNHPSAAMALAKYFFSRKNYQNVVKLCEKVLEFTDVRAIQSDAYYWIGRTHHQLEQYGQASQFYQRARAANENNLAAAIGIGQLQIIQNDMITAKLTFERLLDKNPNSIEALTILGLIYTTEATDRTSKMDKNSEREKAKSLFDKVLKLYEASTSRIMDDPALLLAQAELYEKDDVDKSLQFLEQVVELQKSSSPGKSASPRLLNNLGVLHYTKGDFQTARTLFQSALNESVLDGEKDLEDDSLIMTISYNLSRLEEEAGNIEEARKTYDGLLERHPDYTDALARLTFIDTTAGHMSLAAKELTQVMEIDQADLELRALAGWHLSQTRRPIAKTLNDDIEGKHYTSTLRHYDKHDTYSLIGLANLILKYAREQRPSSEAEKEHRKRDYARAVEMFEKALQIDPKSAYAGQGIAIAYAEEKRFTNAILIFNKVRETLNDVSVSINLGHCWAEQRNWTRAIQNYETALEKSGSKDFNILLCLGRVWLLRGRDEKSGEHIRTSIDYTKQALALSPENPATLFNIAYDYFTLAETLRETDPSNRTVAEIEQAGADLVTAIETMTQLSNHKQPPWPREDLVQRARFGNTLRTQLDRALADQKEYERENAERLDASRRAREEEERAKKEKADKLRAEEHERQRLLADERRKVAEEAKAWAVQNQELLEKEAEFEAERKKRRPKTTRSKKSRHATPDKEEGDLDGEDGYGEGPRSSDEQKVKTKKRRLMNNNNTSYLSDEKPIEDNSGDDEEMEEQEPSPKKKRKLVRYALSEERVVDSDSDEEMSEAQSVEDYGSPEKEETDNRTIDQRENS